MTREELKKFKQRLNQHFLSELCIMKDIIESHLSKDELKQLNAWMKNNPYDSVVSLLRKKAGQQS